MAFLWGPEFPLATNQVMLKRYAILQLSSLPAQEVSVAAHLLRPMETQSSLSLKPPLRLTGTHQSPQTQSILVTLESVTQNLGSATHIPHLLPSKETLRPSHMPTSPPRSKETPEQSARLQSLPKAASTLAHTLPSGPTAHHFSSCTNSVFYLCKILT